MDAERALGSAVRGIAPNRRPLNLGNTAILLPMSFAHRPAFPGKTPPGSRRHLGPKHPGRGSLGGLVAVLVVLACGSQAPNSEASPAIGSGSVSPEAVSMEWTPLASTSSESGDLPPGSIWTLALGLGALATVEHCPDECSGDNLWSDNPGERTGGSQPDPNAASTCALCHGQIHKEWKGSVHGTAWTNEHYQKSLESVRIPRLCYPCHAPTNVLGKLGARPKTRKENRAEGVTCVSCHKKGDTIHGPFGAETDAHPSEKHPAFSPKGSYDLCASCHDKRIGPVLPLARDFKASGLMDKGKSCIGCHMAAVERPIAFSPVTGKPSGKPLKGRSHALRGPMDAKFAAKAFRIGVARVDGNLELSVENKAGHRVPGLTLREFRVRVTWRDGKGKDLRTDQVVFSSENLLKATEVRRFPLDPIDGVETGRIVVEHWLRGKLVAKLVDEALPLGKRQGE